MRQRVRQRETGGSGPGPCARLALTLGILAAVAPLTAADWPQFEGPLRNGTSPERGLARSWPEDGPRILWRAPLGEGFSGIAVHAGRVFTLLAEGADEYAVALAAEDGAELWRFRTDAKILTAHGNGPRSTPTVDGETVFVVGARGKLYALDVADGRVRWQRDLERELGAQRPHWGTASSPLVDGDRLVVQVGGDDGRAFAAFDRQTGEVLWTSQSDLPAYSSPVVLSLGGQRQALFFSAESLVALDPGDGRLLWRIPWATEFGVNVATPLRVPPDRVFVSSAYDVGSALLEIRRVGDAFQVDTLWRNRKMQNLFHSSVHLAGQIYGFHDALLKCLDAGTGRERWVARGFGRGSLIAADGLLFVWGERGLLALVEASAESYRELARAQVLSGRTWPGPALADGRLYLRNEAEMVCLEVAAGAGAGEGER